MYRSARRRERNLNTPLWPINFQLGMWIWVLQRLSGLILVLYLLAHIVVISTSIMGKGQAAFNDIMELFHSPLFIIGEVLLMAAVFFHATNGVRILLFDMGIGVRQQKLLFWIAAAVAAAAWIAGAYFLVPLAFK